MEKIGKFDFSVAADQLDRTGRMSLCAITGKMLDCAGMHAKARGFGLSAVNEKQATWVVSRLAVELYETPSVNEPYSIITWVESVYRHFTNRCFEVQDQNGKVMGYARSIWALIDLESRKSEDLNQIYGDALENYVAERECPIASPERIRITNAEMVAEIPVVQDDIDFNGHVNSVKYMEHILSLFSSEEFAERKISRFDIAYVTEALMGDTLRYYLQTDGEDKWSVEVRNHEENVICRALLNLV